jgi:hypothetical protein
MMTEDQKDTIREAAQALRDACMYRFEKYTEFSTSDRSDWTYEEECRYGSDCDYELSLKLDEMTKE